MSAVTSFKRKSSSKASHPNGTKPSLHNAQLLTSTGVPSLDPLLGCKDTIYTCTMNYQCNLLLQVVVFALVVFY